MQQQHAVSRKIRLDHCSLTMCTASQYVISKSLSFEYKRHSSDGENSHYKASNANQKQTELELNALKPLQSNRWITWLQRANTAARSNALHSVVSWWISHWWMTRSRMHRGSFGRMSPDTVSSEIYNTRLAPLSGSVTGHIVSTTNCTMFFQTVL